MNKKSKKTPLNSEFYVKIAQNGIVCAIGKNLLYIFASLKKCRRAVVNK